MALFIKSRQKKKKSERGALGFIAIDVRPLVSFMESLQ